MWVYGVINLTGPLAPGTTKWSCFSVTTCYQVLLHSYCIQTGGSWTSFLVPKSWLSNVIFCNTSWKPHWKLIFSNSDLKNWDHKMKSVKDHIMMLMQLWIQILTDQLSISISTLCFKRIQNAWHVGNLQSWINNLDWFYHHTFPAQSLLHMG